MFSASSEVRDVMQRRRSRGTYEDWRLVGSKAERSLSVVDHGVSLTAGWKLVGPRVSGESGTPSLPQPSDELVEGVSGRAVVAAVSSSSLSFHQFHQSAPVRSSDQQHNIIYINVL